MTCRQNNCRLFLIWVGQKFKQIFENFSWSWERSPETGCICHRFLTPVMNRSRSPFPTVSSSSFIVCVNFYWSRVGWTFGGNVNCNASRTFSSKISLMVSRKFDKSVWVQDNWMMRGGWDGLGLGCGANDENSSGCTSHCYILTFEMYLWSIINYQAFRCSFSFLWLFDSDEEISRKSKRFISKSNIWGSVSSDLENRCKSRRYFPLRFGAPWTFSFGSVCWHSYILLLSTRSHSMSRVRMFKWEM